MIIHEFGTDINGKYHIQWLSLTILIAELDWLSYKFIAVDNNNKATLKCDSIWFWHILYFKDDKDFL